VLLPGKSEGNVAWKAWACAVHGAQVCAVGRQKSESKEGYVLVVVCEVWGRGVVAGKVCGIVLNSV